MGISIFSVVSRTDRPNVKNWPDPRVHHRCLCLNQVLLRTVIFRADKFLSVSVRSCCDAAISATFGSWASLLNYDPHTMSFQHIIREYAPKRPKRNNQEFHLSFFGFGSLFIFLRCVHFFGEFVQLDGEVRKKKEISRWDFLGVLQTPKFEEAGQHNTIIEMVEKFSTQKSSTLVDRTTTTRQKSTEKGRRREKAFFFWGICDRKTYHESYK